MRSGCFSRQFCVHKLVQTMLILLVVSPTLAGWSWSQEPTFDILPSSRELSNVAGTVTLSSSVAIAGQTALLPCTVRNLGDKVVSWIRNRDLHILTSGIYTFTSDSRFEVVHRPNEEFWGLQIKNTQLTDSGKYECQVNTDPKMNYPVLLSVTDSHMHDSPMADGDSRGESGVPGIAAAIHGPRQQYVRVGSTITFTCVVSRASVTQLLPSRAQLKWTHAGRDVTFQSSRGGISIVTAYRPEHSTSSLTVAMVTLQDAGTYTCHDAATSGSGVTPASVLLHVVQGERSEAMQRDPPNGAQAFSSRNFLLPLLFVYFNWILR